MKILSIAVLLLAGFIAQAHAASDADSGAMNVDGVWFSCEFAHSQIPPDDGCKMLDDDGFLVADGRIDHVKVTDSRQLKCRHQRLGQCFDRNRASIKVSRDQVGPIHPTASGFAITYWGCTQQYSMVGRGDYFEVTPQDRLCLWAKDKRYFVSRYGGKLDIADK